MTRWGGGSIVVAFAAGAAAGVGDHVGFFAVFIWFGAGGGLVMRGRAMFAAGGWTAAS